MKLSTHAAIPALLAVMALCQGCTPGLPMIQADLPAEQSQPDTPIGVPSPGQMVADVLVNGRLSQVRQIDIQPVGQQIPYTYSQGKIANSPGYRWWVSKHFALKSDLPEEKVRLYLELLELSYPQYAALFGAEPANIEHQRIAVVYGKSRASTRNAMLDDGFLRGVHANAGGETMYYNRTGYSFPSSREQHQRYIVIHETMHAYHMALSGHSTWAPNWITEGLADSIASHVYYPKTKTLAVMVRDRAPMDYLRSGLKQYYAWDQGKSLPSIEAINNSPALKRGLNFFIIHFLLDDPERAEYFAWYRDRLMAANPHSEATLPTAQKLLKEVFPNWPELERAFSDYVAKIKPSFHGQGPWEQDGNAYWIRVGKEKQTPRLDINISPAGQQAQPFVMDFPGPGAHPLISPPGYGRLGLLVEFQPGQLQRSQVGMALGLELGDKSLAFRKNYQGEEDSSGDQYASLWLKQGRYLVLQDKHLGYHSLPLSPALLGDLRRQDASIDGKGAELGVNIQLNKGGLNIQLRSNKASQDWQIALPERDYQRLLNRPVALLASQVSHRLTPYLADGRQAWQPKLQGQNSNTWGFAGAKVLQNTFRACQHSQAPEVCWQRLQPVYKNLQQGGSQPLAIRQLADVGEHLLTKERKNHKLLAALSGISMELAFDRGQPFIQLLNPSCSPAWITLRSNTAAYAGLLDPQAKARSHLQFELAPGRHRVKLQPGEGQLDLQADVRWRDQGFSIYKNASLDYFDGVELAASADQTSEGLHIKADLSGPYSGKTQGTIRFEVFPSTAVADGQPSFIERDITVKPYRQQTSQQGFTLKPAYKGRVVVGVNAVLVVDGEDLQIRQSLELNRE